MPYHDPHPSRPIVLALFGVLAVLLWPIWLMIAAAEREFNAMVLLSALIPLGFTAAVILAALDVPAKVLHRVDDRLHARPH
ncbi:MAG: hypothetical protein QOF68_689 [Gaiellales bacterium]|jgi:hypothetical protein|nr:hypothetical protein [Gaiellales bacterium]